MNRQPITRTAVLRLLRTRQVIEASMRAARNAVIRQQLVAMRRTYPA
jgi:hypothetical protein